MNIIVKKAPERNGGNCAGLGALLSAVRLAAPGSRGGSLGTDARNRMRRAIRARRMEKRSTLNIQRLRKKHASI